MSTLQAELQRLSGTTLDATGAANAWAGTTGRALVEALNVKAGTTGLALQGVLNRIAGTSGLAPVGALRGTILPPKMAAPTATATSSTSASVAFTALTSTPTPTSYTVTSSGGQTATGTTSPISVTGLAANTSYTFTVKATNIVGTGPDSDPSAAITTPLL